MGNVCCADEIRRDANGKATNEIDGNNMMKGIKRFNTGAGNGTVGETVDSSPYDAESFGCKGYTIEEKYFKPSKEVQALIEKHGLFRWESGDQEVRDFVGHKVYRVMKGDFTYEGQYHKDKRNGKGVMIKKNGDLWVCPFLDDEPNGTGAIYYDSGDYFVGKIYKGNTIEGKMIYVDGSQYVGQFMTDGFREGKGTYYEPNGARYEGMWKNNMKDGEGVYIIPEVWRQGIRLERASNGGQHLKADSIHGMTSTQNTPSHTYEM